MLVSKFLPPFNSMLSLNKFNIKVYEDMNKRKNSYKRSIDVISIFTSSISSIYDLFYDLLKLHLLLK